MHTRGLFVGFKIKAIKVSDFYDWLKPIANSLPLQLGYFLFCLTIRNHENTLNLLFILELNTAHSPPERQIRLQHTMPSELTQTIC